ncbi:hypothetical protein ARMGADRAFT_1039320 [Armillaria gallica]|uniref:Uncharacterized protein n=1 Tax=Armillaria gallica TaxID=47427 RepID=A0A2H3CZ62_ARMGA|nr:hypothetical protein ARMGADRAFT_1039320 [Armillaria gallica]
MLVDLSLKVKDAASSNSKHLKDDCSGEQATSAKKTKKDVVVELGEPKGRKRRPEHEDGDDVEATVSWKATKKSRLSKPMSKSTSDNPLSKPMPNAAIKTPVVKEPLKLDLPEDAPKWAMNTIKMFKCQDVPERFLQLAETWIKFETREKNWEHTGKLSTVDRPKPIANWINCVQMDRFHLQAVKSGVDPVKDFESKFWSWWSQLQPNFQQRDESDVTLALIHEGRPDTKSEDD